MPEQRASAPQLTIDRVGVEFVLVIYHPSIWALREGLCGTVTAMIFLSFYSQACQAAPSGSARRHVMPKVGIQGQQESAAGLVRD